MTPCFLLYKDPVHKVPILDRLFLILFRQFSDILLIRLGPKSYCARAQEREKFSLYHWKAHNQGKMTVQGVDVIAEVYGKHRERSQDWTLSRWWPQEGGRTERKWWLEQQGKQQLLCIQHLECARPCREVRLKAWGCKSPANYPGKILLQPFVKLSNTLSVQLQSFRNKILILYQITDYG